MTLYLRGEEPRELAVQPSDNNMEYEAACWADWIQGKRDPSRLFQAQEDSRMEMQVLDTIRQLCGIRFPADEN